MIFCYLKNERENITPDQLKALRKLVEENKALRKLVEENLK